MSRVVLLFVGFVCALLFVNVYGQGEFSILTPDGKYKHGECMMYICIFINFHFALFVFHSVQLSYLCKTVFLIRYYIFLTSVDSALALVKVLKKLQDFTLPAGDDMLNKWIATVKTFNKHMNSGDMKAVGKASHGVIVILRGILPEIPDKNVRGAIESVVNKFEKESDSSMTAGTASLADIDKVVQNVALTLISAMSKGKPTAETLN